MTKKFEFDPAKDLVIFKRLIETEHNRFEISLKSYDSGNKKLHLVRMTKTNCAFCVRPIGRFTAEELDKILPVLQEIRKEM
jgi:hypothetical protein